MSPSPDRAGDNPRERGLDYLVPRAGIRVADPPRGILPAAGAWRQLDRYWRRRIIDGDVAIENPPPVSTEPQDEPAAECQAEAIDSSSESRRGRRPRS